MDFECPTRCQGGLPMSVDKFFFVDLDREMWREPSTGAKVDR
jgi:hypothetical protein